MSSPPLAPAMHRDPQSAAPTSCDVEVGARGIDRRRPAAAPPPGRRDGAVWLRSNPRPGVAIAAIAGGLVFAILLAMRPWNRPLGVPAWCLGGGVVVTAAVGMLLATLPRIVVSGRSLRVRLALARVEIVPLECVECFFLGSRLEPPRPGDQRTGGNRVRTLVMRIAERAVEHGTRTTFPPWGAWEGGSVTFDGRWCEPLSVDLVRRLNRELAAAKRGAAGGAT